MRSGALMSEREGPQIGADEDFGFAWIFRFGPDGQGASIPPDAHFELNQPGEGFLWVHLDIGDKRAQSWLRQQSAIPETARYMFAHVGEHHQHIEQSDGVIWGAIFDFVRDVGGATENLGHLRFALGERFLVSARRFPLQSADATRREIESGRRIDAPAALFETIVDAGHRCDDDRRRPGYRSVGRYRGARARRGSARRTKKAGSDSALGGAASSATHRHARDLPALRSAIARRSFRRGPGGGLSADPAHRLPAPGPPLGAGARAPAVGRDGGANRQQHQPQPVPPDRRDDAVAPPTFITGLFGMNVKGLPFTDDEFGFIY